MVAFNSGNIRVGNRTKAAASASAPSRGSDAHTRPTYQLEQPHESLTRGRSHPAESSHQLCAW